MSDNSTTDDEYDKWFKETHKAGAERHGTLWLQANEFVCIKAMRMGIAATTKQNRAMLSVIALSVLDSAKRYRATTMSDVATTEPSVESALKELSDRFPRDYVEIKMFGSRDGLAWSVKIGFNDGAKIFTEDTLSEAMSQVRAWNNG